MPDAFTATFLRFDQPDVAGSQLYRKKALVLANTRQLIAEDGWAKFSLRKLATRCEMSRQTLHNIAGSRSEIAAEAVCDHTVMMHNHVARDSNGQDYFHSLTDHLIEVVRKTPEYSREIIRLYFDFDLPIFRMVNRASFRLNFSQLSHMQRQGLLRDDMDLRALNARIVDLHTICILNFANGLLTFDEFAFNMRMGCEMLLFGALTREPVQSGRQRLF